MNSRLWKEEMRKAVRIPERKGILLILLWMSLLNLAFGPPVLREKDIGGLRLFPGQLKAMKGMKPPDIEAKAYLLADYATGTVLVAYNEHQPLPPASLTKIMTAIIALERSNPEATVTVGQKAVQVEGARMGLRAGEDIPLKDLLYGLLLVSANDAAIAIAEYVAGSEGEFVALMNAKAAELGMNNTHFANCHGLDTENHYASAYDLWLLTRYALANPTFAAIVSTAEHTSGSYRLTSINRFLKLYPGADGVKTGTTPGAGECLIASATREGQKAVAIVLNSPDRYGEAASLLDYYFRNYTLLSLDAGPSPLNLWHSPDGSIYKLEVEGERALLIERWEFPSVRLFREITGPREEHPTRIGHITLYLGDQPLSTRALLGYKVK